MPKEIRNLGASVRARLQNFSRGTGQSFELILNRLIRSIAQPLHMEVCQ